MSDLTTQQLQSRIHELEAEVKKLNLMLQKDSKMKYGLRWIDVPEAFEKESENSVPILEEVKENAIKNDDGKPTHVLIEGDNFHALKCLNYTHKGKIDVIYIDPPYNTENGFVYHDKRVMDKFPDGVKIDVNHPLRHSAWLSFMSKRLELAEKLLSEKGVIFISIDDNEQANLRLLCDRIFGEKNFVGQIVWESTTQPINAGTAKFQLQQKTEAIYCFAKDKNRKAQFVLKEAKNDFKYPHQGKFGKCRFEIIEKSDAGDYKRDSMKFEILGQKPRDGKRWQIGEETARELEKNGRIEIVDGIVKKTVYPEDEEDKISYVPFWSFFSADSVGTAQDGKSELNSIFGKSLGFDTVKPIELIMELISHFPTQASALAGPNPRGNSSDAGSVSSQSNFQLSTNNSQLTTILDFFAGSGTTLHATMKLNESDGGNRQCILVQQDENGICQNVTYERNRRVMQGYENSKGEKVAGLGNSLKYYKTAFVGKNDAINATDSDRIALAQKAGCLLSLAENTLEEIESSEFYQIFSDGKSGCSASKYTGIYFSGNFEQLSEFCERLEQLRNESRLNKINAYFFCQDNGEEFENEFSSMKNIAIKTIPEPILKIYQALGM